MKSFIQTLIGLVVFSLSLYNYLQSLNDLTRLRMQLPQVQQEHLQLQIEFQQLQNNLNSRFNLKAMKEQLEMPVFQHLRRYQFPKKFTLSSKEELSRGKS